MTRHDLVHLLAQENSGLSRADVERIADVFFNETAERLTEGGRVEPRGFGTFGTKQRQA